MMSIVFESNLRLGETAKITVQYDLLGEPPRSESSWVRVNPAYVSFPVIAFADPGDAYVTIDIPFGWTPDYSGHELMRWDDGERLLLEAYEIAAPDEFYLQFTARQDELLESVPLTVAGSDFELRAWPGDTRWHPVRESSCRRGPAGPRTADGHALAGGERDRRDRVVDAVPTRVRRLLLRRHRRDRGHRRPRQPHDPARAVTRLVQRVVPLRSVAERRTGRRHRLPAPWPSSANRSRCPTTTTSPPGFDPGQFELNAWDQPSDAIDDAIETYGYQTSFRVMHELIDEIGEERMTELVAAVLRGDRAYGPEDGDPIDDGAVDWREFLDLAEQIGGSTQLVDDYREHVVSADEAADLDARQDALDRYAELVARGGTWGAPEAVRQRMSAWLFDVAESRIVEAEAALDVRDELSEELSHIDLAPASQIERQYQDTDDLESVVADLTEQLAAARRIVRGRAAMIEQLDALGLDAPALTQTAYEEAPLELAVDTEQLAEQAGQLVEADRNLDQTLATFALSIPDLEADSFAASPELAVDTLDDYQQAADAVVDAHLARNTAGSVAERIGEVGSDADRRLSAADAALAAGDTTGAIDNARAATAAISDWESRGRIRLAIAVLIVAAVVLLVLLVLVVRRRRHRSNASLSLDDGSTAETDPTTELRQTWPDDRPDERLDDRFDGRLDDAIAGDAADPADARQVGARRSRPLTGCSTSRSGTASAASCSATATRSSWRAATSARSTATSPSCCRRCSTALPERCVVDGEIVVPDTEGNGLDFDALQQRIHPAAVTRADAGRADAGGVRGLRHAGDRRPQPDGHAVRRAAGPARAQHLDAERQRAPHAGHHRSGDRRTLVHAVRGGRARRRDGQAARRRVHARQAHAGEGQARTHRRLRRRRVPDPQGRRGRRLAAARALRRQRPAQPRRRVRRASASSSGASCATSSSRSRENALDDHPWREWAELQAHSEQRMPGGFSRWNVNKDLSFVPIRVERVVEVTFGQLESGRFRHGVHFVRWRPDRTPESCRYEQLEVASPVRFDELLAESGVDCTVAQCRSRSVGRGRAARRRRQRWW